MPMECFSRSAIERRTEVHERAEKHVAARSGKRIDDQRLLSFSVLQISSASLCALRADARRNTPGAKTVVDIDNRYTGAAAVEHSQECGKALEVGPVTHAGRQRHDRRGGDAGDDARQRPFHTGGNDDHVGVLDHRAIGEQPVHTGNTDIVDPVDVAPEEFRRYRGFLGHRNIGRARSNHEHVAESVLGFDLNREDLRGFEIVTIGKAIHQNLAHRRIDPRH